MRPTDNPPRATGVAAWKAAFANESGKRFSDLVAREAVLEGSVFAHPVTGRDAVWNALRLSGSIYDRLEFTREVITEDRTYLEWEASAVDLHMSGVTALTTPRGGSITHIALHHRPLDAVTRFSAEFASRASGRSASTSLRRQPVTFCDAAADDSKDDLD
jgi:hypothetical protein